ncbi:MAG: alpha-galactosidase [Armatimonadota bacterium]|nr:MAG: alpha-galactosidase [Armatimonadota bacterium]
MKRMRLILEVLTLIMATQWAHGVSVVPAEMAEARRWAAAKFEGVQEAPPREAGLIVLANNDPVQPNARAGRPMKIVDQQYTRGLYCHAYSNIVVRLPGPGKTFEAIIGVDSNEQTSGGRGSVVFSVKVGDREAFRSDVMREGMPGIVVSVNLGGADEFVIEVGDAGDGIGCDQADWADARVTLTDGSVLWLGDMPLGGPARGPYTTEPPFSFTYDGRPSGEVLKTWTLTRAERAVDDKRTEHAITYNDPETGLVMRCVAVEYHDFPIVEWTLYFKNAGSADTPILEDIQALDTHLERSADGEFVLHHHTGSPCTPTDYEPFATTLDPASEKRIATAGGRPTNSDLPYFNIEWPGEGVVIALGWPGQWAAQFARDDGIGLRIRGGQELTHFTLHPGEEVRSPLVVMQFYRGDWIRAQNVWRRWMLAHNLPRPGGKLPPAQMAACSSHQYGEMINANEETQIMFVDRYLEEGIELDYWWMDAGWYINESGWPNTGTWEVDTKRFPRGLRFITDHAHAKGVKSIVWFEPERVTPGTWLYENHPEWLLGRDGETKLLNLGNPEARQWLTEHVNRLINEQGIDLYRNDFNIDPLGFWRGNDSDDRQGITEIRYVEGFLAYWDELRRRHPDMLIDTCASGGRRNDLETLRRSVPLLRSDCIIEPVAQQLHTYGIAFWIPFYGTGVNSTDPYVFRSQASCPHLTGCYDMRNREIDYEELRRLYTQWRSYADCYFGDYYPLTPYDTGNEVWMAWQFDRPESGDGIVQVFRRADSIYESARLRLRGLDPDATYVVTDLDGPGETKATGREIMDPGVLVACSDRPGSAVIMYRREQ